MALWTDVISPAELTGFSREAASQFDANAGTLSDVFPTVSTSDVNFKWYVNEKVQDVASFRSFDAESKIGSAAGLEEKIASLTPISLKKRFGEYDQLVRSGQNSPESVQAAADRLATEVSQGVVRRLIQARGEALVTGALSINEDGVVANVDFGRRSDHTVDADVAWDVDGSDPIADLEAWREAYVDHTGQEPTGIKASPRIVAALQRNENLRGYLGTTAPTLLDRATVNSILVGYGLPEIEVVNTRVAGQPVLDGDYLVLTADGAGATVYGTTIEASDARYGLADAALPGLVVGAYAEDDPNIKWIRANAVALPILGNPDLTFAARVLAIAGS